MLHLHVVVKRNVREAYAIVWCRVVARGSRQSVTQHIRDNDEVFYRIEGHAFPDQPLIVVVLTRVPGRIDNHVAPVGIELAVGLISQLCVAPVSYTHLTLPTILRV